MLRSPQLSRSINLSILTSVSVLLLHGLAEATSPWPAPGRVFNEIGLSFSNRRNAISYEIFALDQIEQIELAAEMFYSLIHVRYILTTKGLGAMMPESTDVVKWLNSFIHSLNQSGFQKERERDIEMGRAKKFAVMKKLASHKAIK
ncbi:hypothetical protein L6452_13461 [Arctium lappa]|uniref:Uncharacterized protein n=1 Tax=Arctium lappa TaxID=4217 RepID=A0ACB9CIA1_ARCLA|nr:hypothetical protein L6452_13461 [Arctium lappa]